MPSVPPLPECWACSSVLVAALATLVGPGHRTSARDVEVGVANDGAVLWEPDSARGRGRTSCSNVSHSKFGSRQSRLLYVNGRRTPALRAFRRPFCAGPPVRAHRTMLRARCAGRRALVALQRGRVDSPGGGAHSAGC